MGVFSENAIIGASAAGGYDIDQSLRFKDGSSGGKLTFTPSSTASSNKKYTYSFWFKGKSDMAGLNANKDFDFITAVSTDWDSCSLGRSNGKLNWYHQGGTGGYIVTTQEFRDPASWYHCVLRYDSTDSTAGDRMRMFINGEEVTAFSTDTNPALNYSILNLNQSGVAQEVNRSQDGSYPASCYMAEVHMIDGQALTPTSFGETNEDTNQWQAIKYAGSYGTNGFYLKFQDSSALGDDSSGNTNDFTPTNLAATDQVLDSPTNNFATLNPIYEDSSAPPANVAFAEGNLSVTGTSGNFGVAYSTMPIPASGKWYLEAYIDNGSICGVGIVTSSGRESVTNGWGIGAVTTAQGFVTQGDKVNNSSATNFTLGTGTPSNGDIYQLAIDADNNKVWIGLDNSWNDASGGTTGNPSSGSNHTIALTFGSDAQIGFQRHGVGVNTGMVGNFGQDSSFAGNKTAQGNGGVGEDFFYTPPTGYKALNSSNLDDPAIALPTDHFKAITYTGTGSSATNAITGVGFAPDLIWLKDSSTTTHHGLFDKLRGTGKRLVSNLVAAEDTQASMLSAFGTDGFTTSDHHNTVNNTHVAWNWKANGSGSSNTDGTINTTATSANTTAGFSLSTFTGNGTPGATIGHGLSQAPELVIIKGRNTTNEWTVGWGDGGAAWTDYMYMNQSAGAVDDLDFWRDTYPSASVITLGSNASVNGNTNTYVSYAWHSVEGYSKIGTFTGNGAAAGPFVYTGFKPAFIMLKGIIATVHWHMFDNARYPTNPTVTNYTSGIHANQNNNEGAGSGQSAGPFDLLSNGFKIRSSAGNSNNTGTTFIYIAFAESPFKTANAR